jgi:CBS domain containing-hemolysin-like protein
MFMIVLLIAANAFFAMAEFSVISARKMRLRKRAGE